MSGNKRCTECQSTESTKFRSLNGEKWREAESKGLVKVMWEEGVVLCNSCYMQFVENPLRRGLKRVKVIEVEDGSTPAIILELADAIKAMAKILYEREYVEKKGPIYVFDEMRNIVEESDPIQQLDRLSVISKRWIV